MTKSLLGLLLCCMGLSCGAVCAMADDDGWVQLFDGKTLKGWTQKNGTATYRVEDGAVVGKTNPGSPNSFLCTDKDYTDFDLEFEVLVDDGLNSGVQFRSKSIKERDNGRVHGPQVEIDKGGSAGRVYGESLGTDWLCDLGDEAAQKAFKVGEWNKYRVKAVGKTIETWVNGVRTAKFDDERSKMDSGFIALQVHGIADGTGPFQVRWKNIKIKDLSKK